MSEALAGWDADTAHTSGTERARVDRNLERFGFVWDGRRLRRRPGVVPIPYADRLTGTDDIEREVERILVSVERDPADAITAARSLVEVACTTVLDTVGEPIDDRDDLPALYKRRSIHAPPSADRGDDER